MGRRRFWLGICAGILGLLLVLGSYAGYRTQRLLSEQGIALDWQRLSLSLRGLQLDDISLRQGNAGQLSLQGDQLRLYWLARETPRYRLEIQGLRLDWRPAAARQPPADDPQRLLQRLDAALPWLPKRIELRASEARLPCSSGQCMLRGDLSLSRQDDALQLDALLLRDRHRGELQAELRGLGIAPDSPRQLQATLRLDGHPQLHLQSRLHPAADGMQWSGSLALPQLDDVAWVGDWLSEWLLVEPSALPATPRQAHLNAQWQLQLPPGPWQPQQLLLAPGWLRLDAKLPEPWPLPALGLVSGELELDLHNEAERWQARRLRGDLQLDPQGAPWRQALPAELAPERWRLQVQPLAGMAPGDLGLHLQLSGLGPLQLQADAELGLSQQADWALEVRRLQLDARSERLNLTDSRLDALHLTLGLRGQVTARQLALEFARASRLSVGRIHNPTLELQQLHADLASLRLQGEPRSPELSGPLALRTQRLQHPQLRTQGWQWQGRLDADGERQRLDGTLQADAGLNLTLRLTRDAAGELRLNTHLAELFLRAGNPLAQTLANWPPLLSLDNGRLHGEANLRLAGDSPLQLQASVTGRGLSGIYDRSTLSGVDGELQLRLTGDRLQAEIPRLSAKQIDPGIALGPLQLQARYQASLQRPLAGQLQHQRAELQLLGGRLQLAPATWDLSQPSQLLPLRLHGLDLRQLFRVYPAEGLDGSGLLDGLIPLRLGTGGPSVEQGLIEARAPGGRLRFHSPRIRAMGQANPGMKLVTDALEDFHYDLLSSSLDYDQSGALKLGMRLQGRNPAIEQGRPIHFNINLEEDIPTLLASLQLTAKVSEIIQQRIQQRMRQRVPRESKE